MKQTLLIKKEHASSPKRSYMSPRLRTIGQVKKMTAKIGSQFDALTGTNSLTP